MLGFCFGGRVSFLTGARRTLGAAVTLYGGGIMKANPFLPFPALVDDVPTMRTPWLGMYGVEDHGIPQDEVDALEKETAGRAGRDEGHPLRGRGPRVPQRRAADATTSRPRRPRGPRRLDWLRAHGVG